MRWTEMVICDVEFALVFSWVIREDYNDIHTVLSHAIISNSFILKDLLREERGKSVCIGHHTTRARVLPGV